ncbi:MAG: TetR/AcrR family transcriptional regulator [Reyranellaceae bacterium]
MPPSEAIEAAAFDLFARRGFQITTVRDVMRACGLTQGALYNHFSSKDDLLATIIRSTQGVLEKECGEALTMAGSDPVARLRAFTHTYTRRHARRRIEAVVANREFEWLDNTRLQEIRASRRRIRDMLVRVLDEGSRAGAFRNLRRGGKDDLKIVAMAILNQCTYVAYWFRPGGAWTDEQVAELHADMALRIVGAAIVEKSADAGVIAAQ